MCSSRAEHMSALASQGRQPEQAQDSTGHRNYWQVTFIDQPPHSHTAGGNSAARKQYLWIFSICFLTALVLVKTWKGLFNYRHWLMLCCVCVGFQSAEAFNQGMCALYSPQLSGDIPSCARQPGPSMPLPDQCLVTRPPCTSAAASGCISY